MLATSFSVIELAEISSPDESSARPSLAKSKEKFILEALVEMGVLDTQRDIAPLMEVGAGWLAGMGSVGLGCERLFMHFDCLSRAF